MPPAEIPGVNGLLTLASSVVVVAALYFARDVLIPIMFAMLLSFILAPLARLFDRIGLPHVVSVLFTVILALAVILSLGGLIGTQVAGLASNAPRYESTVEQKITILRQDTLGRLNTLVDSLSHQFQHPAPAPAERTGSPAPAQAPTGAAKPVPVQVQASNPSPFDLAMSILGRVLAPLSDVAIVLIFAVFILLQREDLRDRAIRLFGSGDLHRSTMAMNDAARRLSRYFLTQLAINTGFGIVIGAGLWMIGIPSPLLWGIMAALLRFVPYIGPWLAAAIPLLLAAAVYHGWSTVFWTIGLYAVTEFMIGQAVEPMAYGHTTGLSPFAIIAAATFWTWLWGPIGLIMSTPLTLCLVVLGRHVDRLEFLDVLLGDRPALSPVESFYQRMLAGDPDEAHAQAELLLRERALSAYYDEVAIKGLQLAASDAQRQVLTETQLARVCKAANHLIDDLDAHEDTDPGPAPKEHEVVEASPAEEAVPRPPAPHDHVTREQLPPAWQGETPVLCIAGRGPLDEQAALILSRLLIKHGLGARVAPYSTVARDSIRSFDPTGIAMICVCYLTIEGVPSHLRYMLRRLRQQLPGDVKVLAGLWTPGDEVLGDDDLCSTLGADFAVATLRDAVEVCIAEATRTMPKPEQPQEARTGATAAA